MSESRSTTAGAGGDLKMDRPWRLALIVDDAQAIKVGCAYYALPKRDRGDLDKIAAASGVDQGVAVIIDRLIAAGMIQDGDPPAVFVQLMTSFVAKSLKGK